MRSFVIALLTILTVATRSHAALDEDAVVALHAHFMTPEKLDNLRHQLRARNEHDQNDRQLQRGRGYGRGGNEFQQTIWFLHDNLGKIKRRVKKMTNGVIAKTTSKNRKVTRMLRKHVELAIGKLDNDEPVRQWDPLYNMLFQYNDLVTIKAKRIKGGVKVTETAMQKCPIAMIQGHADAVSGFINTGWLGQEHSVPDICTGDEAWDEV
jgi:hypothetical protein